MAGTEVDSYRSPDGFKPLPTASGGLQTLITNHGESWSAIDGFAPLPRYIHTFSSASSVPGPAGGTVPPGGAAVTRFIAPWPGQLVRVQISLFAPTAPAGPSATATLIGPGGDIETIAFAPDPLDLTGAQSVAVFTAAAIFAEGDSVGLATNGMDGVPVPGNIALTATWQQTA